MVDGERPCGGAATEDDAIATLTRVPGLNGRSQDERLGVASWVAELYSARASRYWGSLQPDRIGEHLVGGVTADWPDLVAAVLDGATPDQRYQALTVLTWTATTTTATPAGGGPGWLRPGGCCGCPACRLPGPARPPRCMWSAGTDGRCWGWRLGRPGAGVGCADSTGLRSARIPSAGACDRCLHLGPRPSRYRPPRRRNVRAVHPGRTAIETTPGAQQHAR